MVGSCVGDPSPLTTRSRTSPSPPLTPVIRSVNRQDECAQPSLHQIDILIVAINKPTVAFRLRTNHSLTIAVALTARFLGLCVLCFHTNIIYYCLD